MAPDRIHERIAITVDEVAGWFPDEPHGRPNPGICADLAGALEKQRQMLLEWQADPRAAIADARVLSARRLTAKQLRELVAARRSAPQRVSIAATRLITAAQDFLAEAPQGLLRTPPKSRYGAGPPPWIELAHEWAADVQIVLLTHLRDGLRQRAQAAMDKDNDAQAVKYLRQKLPKVSLNAADSPVVEVLSHAIRRLTGKTAEPAEIGRWLRVQRRY